MDDAQRIGAILAQWASDAAKAHCRLPLMISGEADWCRQQATSLLTLLAQSSDIHPSATLWVGEEDCVSPPPWTTVAAHHLASQLGRENTHIVYDAHLGLDPDGLSLVAGTLRAGGLFICLLPELSHWHCIPDAENRRLAVYPIRPEQVSQYFHRRIAALIEDDGRCLLWRQEEGLRLPEARLLPAQTRPVSSPYATEEQQAAVATIIESMAVAQMTIVLRADRGRGKSAALGIAAAQLHQQGYRRLAVTAPSKAAVAILQQHYRHLSGGDEGLAFYAPDELLHQRPELDLLLVDEAAAIPVPMLQQMLSHYQHLIFATTVHGYEGTGRGFDLRFRRHLDRQRPGWHLLQLRQPVRYAMPDPLEEFLFRAMLLDAAAVDEKSLGKVVAEACDIQWLSSEQLLEDEELLRQLFGLLILAHYQTRPMDLRYLLDGPNLRLCVMRHRDQVVGAAMVAEEGGFDPALCEAIFRGQRRPRGHLLPQSLALHGGVAEAAGLRGWRVVRIAIHPFLHRQGLGGYLLQWLQQQAAEARVDFLGASFAASVALIHFWQQHGLQAVRLGLRAETNSGAHSMMMIQPISVTAEPIITRLRRRFRQQLPLLMQQPQMHLEASLQQLLQEQTESPEGEMEAQDWLELKAYVAGERGYELSLLAIQRFLSLLAKAELSPLMRCKFIERRAWSEVVEEFAFSGRREAEAALQKALGERLEDYEASL